MDGALQRHGIIKVGMLQPENRNIMYEILSHKSYHNINMAHFAELPTNDS
jgi:hypothetical protein